MGRQNNFDKYTCLRSRFHTFSLDGFDYHTEGNSLSVKFRFSIDDKFSFSPQSSFFVPNSFTPVKSDALEYLIFHIAMVELISYWKVICPPKVIVKPYMLNHEQITWWKKLWFHGLGEFFWLNSIDTSEEDFMSVECHGYKEKPTFSMNSLHNAVIVPIGGGKDSAVTIEFFRQQNLEIYPMLVNPRGAMTGTLDIAQIPPEKAFVVRREIDPLLFELNAQGYLNGHTPFSSLLAFHAVLFSYVSGIRDIALSNESSANESTVPGTNINHQYSKSIEFESDFRQYVFNYISRDMNYFSLLRPLSELQIAYLFSRFDWYHHVFRSCNAGSKEDVWCGACPKCLFTAIILLPFTGPEKLREIFSTDMLNNEELIPVFRQLIGTDEVKPFECVGTVEEINTSLRFSINKYFKEKQKPILLEYYMQNGMYTEVEEAVFFEQIINSFDTSHHLTPPQYEQLQRFIRDI
jgi:UDP-N-acetyl-alpha-D-muramoyl-L-alanyl-L-glutamate epimerase